MFSRVFFGTLYSVPWRTSWKRCSGEIAMRLSEPVHTICSCWHVSKKLELCLTLAEVHMWLWNRKLLENTGHVLFSFVLNFRCPGRILSDEPPSFLSQFLLSSWWHSAVIIWKCNFPGPRSHLSLKSHLLTVEVVDPIVFMTMPAANTRLIYLLFIYLLCVSWCKVWNRPV